MKYYIVSFDYGQLEARVIGMLSRCPVLCKEIFNKYDIHGDWTDRLGQDFQPEALKTKETRKHLRDWIKNKWTFPLFFGSVIESVAHDLSNVFEREVSALQLEPHYKAFWDKYKVVLQWQKQLQQFYAKHGYVQTEFGFRRHAPLTINELINAPVQGTAAQLVMDAQTRLSRYAYELDKPQYQARMNIHDDLTFYLPEPSLEEDIPFIAEKMCVFEEAFVTVPLSVEVSLGTNWADEEEIGVFFSTDFGWIPPGSSATKQPTTV